MGRKEIEPRQISIGRPPLVENPDDLLEMPKTQIYRLAEDFDLRSFDLILRLFYRTSGQPPCLRVYEAVGHGEVGFSGRAASDEVDFLEVLLAWSRIKEGEKPVILGFEAQLGKPIGDPEADFELFLFADLDGPSSEENLCFIEDGLVAENFDGVVISTGGSFHFVSFFRVPVQTMHLFYSRLLRRLTPESALARGKILTIADELEKAEGVLGAARVMRAVLDRTSSLYIPSEEEGFATGSSIDLRCLAHAYERSEQAGECEEVPIPIHVLRFSDKSERPWPQVVSVLR